MKPAEPQPGSLLHEFAAARAETNRMDALRKIEASDPSNVRFHQLPEEQSRLVVKHRFGGTAGGDPVKVSGALVTYIREARAHSGHDAFEGEKEIWDARDAMALDESDGCALDQYIGTVVGMQFYRMMMIKRIGRGRKAIGRTMDTACLRLRVTTIKRWPRLRPHWRRFQRRLCDNCPACAHLGEPRYMVCSGCGVARYCSEECQRAHWPCHQEECLAVQAIIKELGALELEQKAAKLEARERRKAASVIERELHEVRARAEELKRHLEAVKRARGDGNGESEAPL